MKKIELACIVDDDSIYVFGLKKLIEIHNLCENLLVFQNGEAAMKYLKPVVNDPQSVPDVILLDINMPVMDGWAFLEEFTKIKPNLAKEVIIYMVSSSIHDNDIEKAKKYSEVSDYVVKPITIPDLNKIFQKA